MKHHGLKLGIATAGIVVLALQIWAKPRPGADTINGWARSIGGSAAWRDRLAPNFEVRLLDGSTFRLDEQVGRRVVIVNFFATWCGPCRAEMPELERYARAHQDEVILLGIDAEEKHTIVEAFVRELQLTFPVGIDASGDVMRLYDVAGFPTTVVIGADGRVKLYETGAISNADIAFDGVVNAELETIQAGRGITSEAYRAALAAEPAVTQTDGSVAPLEGRARAIAEAMPCPCGCDDKVYACTCSTSTKIKARLANGGYDDKTDVEVMQELNREFCMKPM